MSDSCKDDVSNSYDVCGDVVEKLQHMSTADDKDNDIVSICANCGKESDSNNMNICNKCKQVKYCNAVCKKKHRSKHKKACKKRAAELHDEKLFKQPPPAEECPICFIRLPTLHTGRKYKTCCGKEICSGCSYAPVYDNQGNKVDEKKCAFCRTSYPTSKEEAVERLKKRVEVDDAIAIINLGSYYANGTNGYPQDMDKALELLHRAAELGYASADRSIGYAYDMGNGVEVDKKKAYHYYELAAMKGDLGARHNLGAMDIEAGNMDRATKHYMIAVRSSGYSKSLDGIKQMYSNGHATKEDYKRALQSYQTYLGEIKSVHRDKAAAADENYRYY